MTNAMQVKKTRQGYGLENVVDNIFNHTMRRFFDGNLWDMEAAANSGTVPVNVRESENEYQLDVIAPGCRKEDFNVQVKTGELLVSLNRTEENSEKNEELGWVRTEYIQQSFSRSFTLDHTVDVDKISAQYIDGVLRITLPKNEKAKPISIKVGVQ